MPPAHDSRPRLLICSTGTSIAPEGPMRDRTAEVYRQQTLARVASLQGQGGNWLAKVSAETNSLVQMQAEASDEVILLHSDTVDGLICAQVLADVVRREVGPQGVRLRAVTGLDAKDPVAFRREGVPNLFRILREVCGVDALAGPRRPVLNATGGFKSTVPYLTLYGMMQGIDVTYIHELAREVIVLPPAPVGFDYERLARAREALAALKAREHMPRHAFLDLIPALPWEERPYFESLIEDFVDGEVIASAFGYWLQEVLATEQAQVLIGPQVKALLTASEGTVRRRLEELLLRVADPLWRQAKRHAFQGTDLVVYKMGNTAERIACILRGSRVFVCLAYADHAVYERELPQHQQAGFDVTNFVPWTKESATTAVFEFAYEAEDEAESLKAKRASLEAELMRSIEREASLNDAHEALSVTHQSEVGQLNQQVAALKQAAEHMARSHAELASYAERPFWQRLRRFKGA